MKRPCMCGEPELKLTMYSCEKYDDRFGLCSSCLESLETLPLGAESEGAFGQLVKSWYHLHEGCDIAVADHPLAKKFARER